MKKIFIKLDNISLGYLIENQNKYFFHANEKNIADTTKRNPIIMKFFTLNTSGVQEYSEIPNHFLQYLECLQQKELVQQAQINDNDNLFTKLYKISELNLAPINFTISQK